MYRSPIVPSWHLCQWQIPQLHLLSCQYLLWHCKYKTLSKTLYSKLCTVYYVQYVLRTYKMVRDEKVHPLFRILPLMYFISTWEFSTWYFIKISMIWLISFGSIYKFQEDAYSCTECPKGYEAQIVGSTTCTLISTVRIVAKFILINSSLI